MFWILTLLGVAGVQGEVTCDECKEAAGEKTTFEKCFEMDYKKVHFQLVSPNT